MGVDETKIIRKGEGWSMSISAVNTMICNMELVALIGSYCALLHEGFGCFACPL